MALTEDQAVDITWALAQLNANVFLGNNSGSMGRLQLFQQYADYYNGDHPLLFATPKFRETFGTTFKANTENLCRLSVDVIADLLQVTGFAGANTEDDAIRDSTQEIWRMNRMDERAGQIHRNALLFSESYVVVWPDEDGEPVIYPNLPGNIAVQYHPEKMGYIVKAAKYWGQSGRVRLTVYTPDQITRYITKTKVSSPPTTPGAFELYETDDVRAEQANEWGKVPVFRFVNNAGVGGTGESEMRDVIPPQDRLNKGLCDLLLASEYHAYPQRYALGYDIRTDATTGDPINPFKSGPDRMWVNENPAGSFGQLAPGDLEQYLKQIADARMSIARISGIPPHFFGMDSGGWPSGESLKTASERLTRKIKDRQVSIGNTWEDVMRFALEIKGQKDVELDALWEDPTPRLSDAEVWQSALLEQQAGGSREKTLRERDYSTQDMESAGGSIAEKAAESDARLRAGIAQTVIQRDVWGMTDEEIKASQLEGIGDLTQ